MTTIAPLDQPTNESRLAVATAGELDILAIARGFADTIGLWPGLTDPTERCWRTLASTEHFEAFVIAWPVGGSIELHDHGPSSGAAVVAAGSLTETSVGRREDASLHIATSSIPAGGSIVFDRGHVHDVVNEGPRPALSIHVYSPPLRTMSFYGVTADNELQTLRTERYEHGEAPA